MVLRVGQKHRIWGRVGAGGKGLRGRALHKLNHWSQKSREGTQGCEGKVRARARQGQGKDRGIGWVAYDEFEHHWRILQGGEGWYCT